MRTHEVCQCEIAIGHAHEKRTPLFKIGDRLAREVVVGEQTACICIASEGLFVKRFVEFVFVNIYAHRFKEFAKKSHPGINVG